jgi:hypothetical protein
VKKIYLGTFTIVYNIRHVNCEMCVIPVISLSTYMHNTIMERRAYALFSYFIITMKSQISVYSDKKNT